MRRYVAVGILLIVISALCCLPFTFGQGVQPGSIVNPVQVNPPGNALTLQTAWTQTGGTAAATITLTQAASAGKVQYCTGFEVTGGGATGASVINVTLASGGTTVGNWNIAVPAGATAATPSLIVEFPQPIVGLAAGQNMVLTVPSFGAGNTSAAATMHGYTQ